MNEVQRIIRYKTDIDVNRVMPTINEWLTVCNAISQIAFDNNLVSNNVKLHRLVYAEMRSKFKLSSQMTCNAVRHVAAKYSTIKANKQKLVEPVRFTNTAMQMQIKYDFAYLSNGLSVWMMDGRIKGAKVKTYQYADQYKDWNLGGCVLQVKNGNVYILQTVSKQVVPVDTHGAVVGVDRGINCLAVATDGKRQKFFHGGKVKQRKRHYQNVKSSLQKKKAEQLNSGVPSRSVVRLLKRLSGRERRFMRDVNHCVSKSIVGFTVEVNAGIIVLEDLEGIRKSAKHKGKTIRKMINQWSFHELQQFVSYKAIAQGTTVESVPAEYTSQACSNCGHTHKDNRDRHVFKCLSCGYQLHSDLNASRNIRLRSVVARQELCNDGLPVNQPLSPNPLDKLCPLGRGN